MTIDAITDGLSEVSCDVLVIGGGTAGPTAALKAKLKNPKATVILLEKATQRRSPDRLPAPLCPARRAEVPGAHPPRVETRHCLSHARQDGAGPSGN
jgi:NADPH-dependent 2,4-dienoyl-CoA reductase/sulfur reductase-like enzyme